MMSNADSKTLCWIRRVLPTLCGLFVACSIAATTGWADSETGVVTPLPYTQLETELAGQIDFETLQVLPEPGASFDKILLAPGVRMGERLTGQRVHAVNGHDTLTGSPRVPIDVVTGEDRETVAIAYHAGFGSNAAFPLGPDGFDARSGRGEGSLALVFEQAITRFALKLHADYDDPLGSRPAPGPVTLGFFDNTGAQIGGVTVIPHHGVNEYGFRLSLPATALTITNRDPGGIAIDDILYPLDKFAS
ncbi:hypothetical protein O2N63_07700 [Aliiroseovarius sp. KMU-50]|uniref:Secreted protein n=1 Tax=Aliiroseovarius salicola TaxID=3009082 RepID=A0ABT4W1X4_9RHOB|nr:hypothetical protein [Aliiroseovarius sp. KMU-50]MDA5093970.1 hypothetical protein [Aliiroseovarius sp. KMU-50]